MITKKVIDGRAYMRSDSGFYLRQIETGALYLDVVENDGAHEYEETDIPITDEITDTEALTIIADGYDK